MTDINNKRIPLNDLGLEDEELLGKYKKQLETSKYSEAVKVLDDNNCERGIRASVLNAIKQSILNLEIYLLNQTADADTIYSLTQPTEDEMKGKIYWIQPKL